MNLEALRRNRNIRRNLLWLDSPARQYFLPESDEEEDEIDWKTEIEHPYFFLVHYYEGSVNLFLFRKQDDLFEFVGEVYEVPKSFLYQTIEESSGNMPSNGLYAPGKELMAWLKEELEERKVKS